MSRLERPLLAKTIPLTGDIALRLFDIVIGR
jgi:hypothetical protein